MQNPPQGLHVILAPSFMAGHAKAKALGIENSCGIEFSTSEDERKVATQGQRRPPAIHNLFRSKPGTFKRRYDAETWVKAELEKTGSLAVVYQIPAIWLKAILQATKSPDGGSLNGPLKSILERCYNELLGIRTAYRSESIIVVGEDGKIHPIKTARATRRRDGQGKRRGMRRLREAPDVAIEGTAT